MASSLIQPAALAPGLDAAPIYVNTFVTGLWTQRNLLREAALPEMYRRFYQRHDSLVGGSNVEISAKLTLRRRPGLSVYNSQTFAQILRFYGFRAFSALSETLYVIADTATDVYNATGPATKTSIWTKTAGAGASFFQGVGGTLYFGNGVEVKKWVPGGTPATSNVGTATPGSAPTIALAAGLRGWQPSTV